MTSNVNELIFFSKVKKNVKNKYEDGGMLDSIFIKKIGQLI
jgi:hypothetical protein